MKRQRTRFCQRWKHPSLAAWQAHSCKPGMIYKQGAMRAAAALKKGEFSHIDAPCTTPVGLFDTGPDAEERGV